MNTITAFLDQVIHGDCVTVMHGMPSSSVDLVVTDPPYLVGYRARDGRRCLNDDNGDRLKPSFRGMYRLLKFDAFCISFYGWPWIDRFMAAWKEAGFRPVSHLVWVKSHCSREGYSRSHHEVGFLLAKGRPARPEKPLSDVLPWQYTHNELHPNQKPVLGLAPLIEAFSHPGGIVLDPFAGSGTIGVAARACGRRCILIECDWRHCQTACARLQRS
jgi:site-specific DNA-methyltransferase (adenine-specific)